jgi:hypothetical protein
MTQAERFWLNLERADMGGVEAQPHPIVVHICQGCGAIVAQDYADRHPHPLVLDEGETIALGTEIHRAVEKFHKAEPVDKSKRPVRKNNEPQCKANHTSVAWPFVARCVLAEGHPYPFDHIDHNGKEWRNEPCDGCKNIQRMQDALKPKDEGAYYEFERAAIHHRKECPNR